LGEGGGNDQCKDPRIQAATENHPNSRIGQGDTRDKEVTHRNSHCANTEIGVTGSNINVERTDSNSTRDDAGENLRYL